MRERDRDRLLQCICDSLVETRGYRYAWIMLLDQASQFVTAAEAGVGQPEFAALQERLQRGESIACLQRALAAEAVVPMEDRQTLCGPCPLASQECGCTPLAVRLAWNGDVYGVIVASVPAAFATDAEELELVAEVAGDISFALHNMHSEEERRRAENALRLEQSRLEALLQLNQMTDAPLQDITDFVLEAGGASDAEQDRLPRLSERRRKRLDDARLVQDGDGRVCDYRQADSLSRGDDRLVGRSRAAAAGRVHQRLPGSQSAEEGLSRGPRPRPAAHERADL